MRQACVIKININVNQTHMNTISTKSKLLQIADFGGKVGGAIERAVKKEIQFKFCYFFRL